MSKSFLFPYGITMREGGRIDVFPAAEIWFPVKGDEWVSLFLVVDSGASVSALPKSDASVLGVTADNGKASLVGGIGGESLRGWQHDMRVRLGNQIITIPVVFLESESAPRILGRAGVFEKFSLVFQEKRRRTAFVPEETHEYRSLEKILNKLG